MIKQKFNRRVKVQNYQDSKVEQDWIEEPYVIKLYISIKIIQYATAKTAPSTAKSNWEKTSPINNREQQLISYQQYQTDNNKKYLLFFKFTNAYLDLGFPVRKMHRKSKMSKT